MDPVLQAVLSQVDSIQVDTTYGPQILLEHPFAPSSTPNPVAVWLKPKITVKAAGNTVTFAPYGEPGETKWPWVEAAMVFGAAGFAVLLFKWYARPRSAQRALNGSRSLRRSRRHGKDR